MKVKDKNEFRSEVHHILSLFTGKDYAPLICDAIVNDVRKDVEECADEKYNQCDIILGIGRTLTERVCPKANAKKCCICHKPIIGHGHFAAPLKSGFCCDKCQSKVLTARIKQFGRLMIDAEMAANMKRGAK